MRAAGSELCTSLRSPHLPVVCLRRPLWVLVCSLPGELYCLSDDESDRCLSEESVEEKSTERGPSVEKWLQLTFWGLAPQTSVCASPVQFLFFKVQVRS